MAALSPPSAFNHHPRPKSESSESRNYGYARVCARLLASLITLHLISSVCVTSDYPFRFE
jgi:hypothetical protein